MSNPNWLVFQLPELMSQLDANATRFKELLRTPSLSCSLYYIPAGSKEMQSAHEEDELYLVLEGRAQLRVEGQQFQI
ncbi:hypothetical protein [Halochromatium salexigens]|uniref:hypothetical protein n=1 Tax=Halochromatium salexigens TaxID=49447 RepID=UPI001912B7D0